MGSAMVLTKVWNAILRAAAALLLALAIVTPAMAEVACAEDTIMHLFADSAPAAIDGKADVSTEDRDNQKRTPDQPGHCSFNHGHCAALPMTAPRGEQPLASSVSYMSAMVSPAASSSPGTPERPPSA